MKLMFLLCPIKCRIQEEIMQIAENNIGSQMLFEIIQVGIKWLHYKSKT